VFADALLTSLKTIRNSEFTVDELFASYLQERVAGRSNQIPELAPLRNSGHEAGSFVFARAAAFPVLGASPARETGETRLNAMDGLIYVRIPPGSFIMGCSSGDNECLEIEKLRIGSRLQKHSGWGRPR